VKSHRVVSQQPLHEVFEFASHLSDRSFTFENYGAASGNRETDFNRLASRHVGGERDPRTKSTALVVKLRLRQVERIVPFDIAATHIVAYGVPDDPTRCRDYKC
jgi:hypothetical protein